MTEHTPTPWSLCGDGCSCLTLGCPDHPIAKVESGEWGDEYPAMRQVGASLENRYEAYMERIGYGTIDPEVARANALFIQKAVNNHDALVYALEIIANGGNGVSLRWMTTGPKTREQMAEIAKSALLAVPEPSGVRKSET